MVVKLALRGKSSSNSCRKKNGGSDKAKRQMWVGNPRAEEQNDKSRGDKKLALGRNRLTHISCQRHGPELCASRSLEME